MQFASVGEDCVANVWSLPEMLTTGKPKVTIGASGLLSSFLHAPHTSHDSGLPRTPPLCMCAADMSAKVPDSLLTGVRFARLPGKGVVPQLVCASYDSHHLRVFLGL